MFKKIFWALVLSLVSTQAYAQYIHITAIRGSRNGSYLFREPYLENHSPVLVSLGRHTVQFENTMLHVNEIKNYSLSPDRTLFGFITHSNESLKLFIDEVPGQRLLTIHSESYENGDPSLKIYTLNDGRTIVRSNIAQFDLYDQTGQLKYSVSNASGSTKGEEISRLAISRDGSLILAYNPKILFQHSTQSRIQRINFSTGKISSFYYSENQTISNLRISDDGQFVLVTFKHGGRSEVVLFDRFANVIRKFSFHYVPDAVVLTKDDKYVTVTYKNRINVYDVLNGHQVGGTYLRSYLFYVTYFPKDRLILGLAGKYDPSSGRIHDLKVIGVDLKARKLGSGEYNESMKWYKDKINLDISRIRAHHYEIKGFSSSLVLSTENF